MPPNRKVGGDRGEDTVGEETDSYSVSSPISAASTETIGVGVTPEQLERILEANYRSMAALIASLSTSSGPDPSPAKLVSIKVPNWTDQDTPSEYFRKYEQAQLHNGTARSAWGRLLPVYLTGRAQAALAQVDAAVLGDYEVVKETLLESLGDTPACADKRWWTLSRQSGEAAGAFYLRVRSTGMRRMHGLDSKQEICDKMILSRFLSLLPAECYTSVVAKRPRNGQEAARFVQEYEEDRTFSRRNQFKPNGGHSQQDSYYKREPSGGGAGGNQVGSSSSGSNASGNTGSSGSNSVRGASPPKTQGTGNSQAGGVKGGKQDKWRDRKPVTCYGCGEVGHIRPNCPNKVRRVRSPEHSCVMSVDGWLAGTRVTGLRVDTGADRTIVRKEFVPEVAYTGENSVA